MRPERKKDMVSSILNMASKRHAKSESHHLEMETPDT